MSHVFFEVIFTFFSVSSVIQYLQLSSVSEGNFVLKLEDQNNYKHVVLGKCILWTTRFGWN
jgi:hypothetical protein